MKMDTKIDCCRQNMTNKLSELWAKKNLEIEIDIIMGERETHSDLERKIKNWTLGTVEKRKFYLHLVHATMNNRKLSVQEIVNLVAVSKTSIEGFVKECEKANWIVVCREEKVRKITVKPILVELYVKYCDWLAETYFTAELSYLTSSMKYLKSLDNDHKCVNLVDTSV